ncbi:hydroxyethylthiazole kinase [Heliophilum fasciatum]|uniref:Hydroxyethylthiazole kinase n=1 Tax=Heliophilum fasciatum TaxID=35700 RepID=A0A4R2RWU3_9FIRM|nr:hydroxyethylthiazole kinase [Heliophilum fasciatum]MCW2276679.1 hydroxyethylthiazole kinase [Heliophilum fasciatum]TCP68940.1 hydroxyethylthiazole kinase [Heliophilum fasciatum]
MPQQALVCLQTKLPELRARRPLIHHLTNFVTMTDCANMVLATGASPVMAHAPEEVAAMARMAGALVLNIGTLTLPWIDAMIMAGQAANAAGVPVILDPVGAGATQMRTEAALRILNEVKVTIVRANAAEAAALAGQASVVKGVDAVSGDGVSAAKALARQFGVVTAVTGVIDYVSDGEKTLEIANGDVWMSRLTGTGCMASSVVASFCAVEKDGLTSATAAVAFYGAAGEIAAGHVPLALGNECWTSPRGPLSFKTAFFDAIYRLDGQRAAELAKISAAG